MLHFPKVVQVPQALKGLHSARKEDLSDGFRVTDSRTHSRHHLVLTLVDSLVVVAGLVRDAMFVCIIPYPSMVSSMTGTRVSTVNHMLDGDVSRWPSASSLYVDTVYMKRQRKWSTKKTFWKNQSGLKLDSLRRAERVSTVERFNLHTILWKRTDSHFKGLVSSKPLTISCISSSRTLEHFLKNHLLRQNKPYLPSHWCCREPSRSHSIEGCAGYEWCWHSWCHLRSSSPRTSAAWRGSLVREDELQFWERLNLDWF